MASSKEHRGTELRLAPGPKGIPRRKNDPAGCPVFGRCGGCTLLELSYEEQLRRKEEEIRRLFGGLMREAGISPEPIVPSEPYHYRCKVQMAFSNKDKKHLICGNFMPESHRIVPVEECLLDNELADKIITGIKKLSEDFHLPAYDERSKTGVIRHVMVRVGYATGEVMVILVTGTEHFPGRHNFIKALLAEFPMITTVVLNINGAFTSRVLSNRFRTIYGPGYIYDDMLGKRFRLSPGAFYQVNPPQAERLYSKAIELAAEGGGKDLLDAYCGTGTIGILASGHFQRVTGVELNAAAVEDARTNARLNKADNARFFKGDAGEFLNRGTVSPDVVILDPPRSGSSPDFLSALGKAGPRTVVYVSCGPDTQVRDIRLLKKYGYEMKKLCLFDLFPWTEHVETVVQLSKGNISSDKVRV